jgi:phosphoribosyl-dephospho-CoA transferase
MLPRHSWVWLQPAAWSRWLAGLNATQQVPVQRWAQQQWPLIVRRLPANESVTGSVTGSVIGSAMDNESAIGLGLSLPPQADMRPKLAWHCQPGDILRSQQALAWPQLSALMQAAPVAQCPNWECWQSALPALDQALTAQGMQLAFYGSLAWQAWTGLPYLHAQSDIDIYVRVDRRAQLDALLRLLPALDGAGLRLDGEIGFPGERAVAWREWLQADSGKVLVKQQQVYLLERRRLLESLA